MELTMADVDLIERIARAWASLDGFLEDFDNHDDACFTQYMEDSRELLFRAGVLQ